MGTGDNIREKASEFARSPEFAMYISAAVSRADKACWGYTDGTLPMLMGQLAVMMNSPTYSALLALNAVDIYQDLRGMIESARENASDLSPEQMADKLGMMQLLTGWLQSIEVMAQEAAEFDDGNPN